jgi:hypothetical protein
MCTLVNRSEDQKVMIKNKGMFKKVMNTNSETGMFMKVTNTNSNFKCMLMSRLDCSHGHSVSTNNVNSGGNLGGAGGAAAPHLHGKLPNFRKF